MPEDQALAWLMATFDFDGDDLRINREGNLSERQREEMPKVAGKVITVLWAAWVVGWLIFMVVSAATTNLAWPNAVAAWLGTVLLSVLFFAPLWLVWAYPLGQNRVQVREGLVCGTSLGVVVVDESDTWWQKLLGDPPVKSDPIHWPTGIPEARLYFNRAAGKTRVHSIEPIDSR